VAVAFFILAACPASTAAITFPLEAKWSASLPAPPAFAPAFDADHVYISLKTNQLVALAIKDGRVVWSVECPMSAPPAAGGGLVFAGSDGLIEARAETSGGAQWRRPVSGRVLSLHWEAGWLIAQTDPGLLLVMRAADGEILWQKDFGSPLKAPPAPAGDRLYLGLEDGRVVALSLQAGGEIWTRKFAEAAAGILPVGDRVYIGGRDNYFHSLDAEDGDGDWKFATGADLLGLPVLDDKRVYFVALDNVIRGHNRNGGSRVWKQLIPVRPFTGPLLSGETLIVSGVAAELYGYSTLDGKRSGPYSLKGAEQEEMLLAAPPHLTASDTLILVTKGGQVRSLGTATAPAEAPPAPPAPDASPDAVPDADAADTAVPADAP
jgi:outer membrane protein assembly factor BamB